MKRYISLSILSVLIVFLLPQVCFTNRRHITRLSATDS